MAGAEAEAEADAEAEAVADADAASIPLPACAERPREHRTVTEDRVNVEPQRKPAAPVRVPEEIEVEGDARVRAKGAQPLAAAVAHAPLQHPDIDRGAGRDVEVV